jgi:AAA domain-containing protein
VRLIGDDQQLAAIGAGGVLRDIENTYGAVRLTELHRFHDPAEAAASLALRDGKPEALGFYLDRQRIHVGDLAALTENLFDAWQVDRSRGLDSIMLAPTRDLVAELNQKARAHRLQFVATSGPEAALADGNRASAGELIITRRNDRRLRTTATDWVKNGDRWTVLTVDRDGGLRVRHGRSGRAIRLPANYVRDFVELGYATTIHAAQGITADTMHGLLTGTESRQLLYTMCTRGRLSNHIYLQLLGNGDPHTLIRPDTIRPSTATEVLEHILARDNTSRSASTILREQQDAAVRLRNSVERYIDALHLAAEKIIGPSAVQALEGFANQLAPGLTEEPAWPTLRGHLLLLAANGADPHQQLCAAYDAKEINSADHRAAVLDWRLADPSLLGRYRPLPWLPSIPDRIDAEPTWGPYLHARSHLVAQLVDQIRLNAGGEVPAWVVNTRTQVSTELIADIQVWRAVNEVDAGDLRPTGEPQYGGARVWQELLDQRLTAVATYEDWRWRQLLATQAPSAIADSFLPELTERLSNLSRAGFDASMLVRSADAAGPLPDDHPAAALWWRILDQIPTKTPNHDSAAVPTTRRTTTMPHGQQRPAPHSGPRPAFGPSR